MLMVHADGPSHACCLVQVVCARDGGWSFSLCVETSSSAHHVSYKAILERGPVCTSSTVTTFIYMGVVSEPLLLLSLVADSRSAQHLARARIMHVALNSSCKSVDLKVHRFVSCSCRYRVHWTSHELRRCGDSSTLSIISFEQRQKCVRPQGQHLSY